MSSGFTLALLTGKIVKIQAKTGIARIMLDVAEKRKGRDGAEDAWFSNVITVHVLGDAADKVASFEVGDRAELQGLISQFKYKEGEANRSRVIVTAFSIRKGGPLNQNIAVIMGRCGRDPELKTFASGGSEFALSLATDEWDKLEKKDITNWIDVRIKGDGAPRAAKIVTQGKNILVKGTLQTDTWDKDGVKHSRTYIKAWDFRFAGSAGGSGGGSDPGDVPDMPFDDDLYGSYEDALESGRAEGHAAQGQPPGEFPQSGGGKRPTPPQSAADLDDEIPF